MVRNHDWPEREVNDKKFSGKQVKDFYIQMLLNPATRRQAIVDVRKDLPEVPELNLEELEKTDEKEEKQKDGNEARQMPECRYCGEDNCGFCNPTAPEDQEEEVACGCPEDGACSLCPETEEV
jgi:hypothetical protein